MTRSTRSTESQLPVLSGAVRTARWRLAGILALLLLVAAWSVRAQQGQSATAAGNAGTGATRQGSSAPPAQGRTAQGGTQAAGQPAARSGSSGPSGPAAQPGAAAASGQQPAPGQVPNASPPPPDMGNIDQILEGDEDVLAGGGNTYSYDPGNRRDPFKSLLIAPDRPEFRGPRPEGIPGLLIDEIDLKGIYRTARGYVAQVNAANQKKSYLLKEGDQLYDGDVVSISHNEVTFKQIVQDPTALKPFREVVKSLNPQ